MKNKIFDCVTFFQENLQMELRFNILNEVVDKFIVCESIYDHRGREKKINFSKNNFPEISSKIEHVVVTKKFPKSNTPWNNQSWQREFIFEGLKDAGSEDFIMFSDPDEIPNPQKLKDFHLNKKYGIFLQDMYTYKLNLYNKFTIKKVYQFSDFAYLGSGGFSYRSFYPKKFYNFIKSLDGILTKVSNKIFAARMLIVLEKI